MPDPLGGDGSRHEHEEEVYAEFMFGLLDYETWNIYVGPRWIGQVTINPPDHSAAFTAGDEYTPKYEWMTRGNLRNWRNWLMAHQAERGRHYRAF